MNFGKINSVIIMGGGMLVSNFAIELKKNNFEVMVVTSPRQVFEDKKFHNVLKDNNISFLISENISTESKVIEKITNNTLGISVGASWILKKEFIEKFNGKLLNIHGARLPRDRGGGNFSWLALQSKRLGYCLIHKLDQGIDTGEIVKISEFYYPPECRIPIQYKEYYLQQNENFLKEFIGEIKEEKDFDTIKQPEYLSTYWPRLSTEHNGLINWNWNLKQIEQFICAFDEPYMGASTFIDDKKVFVKNCMISTDDGIFHPYQKGLIYRKTTEAFFVATEDGSLIIKKIVDEKGNDMVEELKVGDRLFTSIEHLEKAQKFRPIYTSKGLKENPE